MGRGCASVTSGSTPSCGGPGVEEQFVASRRRHPAAVGGHDERERAAGRRRGARGWGSAGRAGGRHERLERPLRPGLGVGGGVGRPERSTSVSNRVLTANVDSCAGPLESSSPPLPYPKRPTATTRALNQAQCRRAEPVMGAGCPSGTGYLWQDETERPSTGTAPTAAPEWVPLPQPLRPDGAPPTSPPLTLPAFLEDGLALEA